jgi:hypothetical protein
MTKTERTTRMMRAAIEAPRKAPWFAYPIALACFAGVAYRLIGHVPGTAEPLEHRIWDWTLLALGLCSLPGFASYLVDNASHFLGFWKRYRKEK